MAKKNLAYFIPGAIALVFGVAACCMMFLVAVEYSKDLIIAQAEYSYTGAQIAFGYKQTIGEGSLSMTTSILQFNLMAFLAFFLPAIGGLLALLFKNGLITKIVTTACFVVGAVFLFTISAYATVGMEAAQQEIVSHMTASLGIGPILGGIFAIIGAFVCFFKGTIAKTFSR